MYDDISNKVLKRRGTEKWRKIHKNVKVITDATNLKGMSRD
jgi:hypothetical protein